MEAYKIMKGIIKSSILVGALALLGACSSMKEIPERDTYAQPKWYQNCAESGSEGWFWWKEEYAYACGAGESRFFQGAEEQMYAIAMNHFAKRINGKVNSETTIDIENDTKYTRTTISYKVTDTSITEHLAEERGNFIFQGKHYTFVKLKMNKEVFDRLLQQSRVSYASPGN